MKRILFLALTILSAISANAQSTGLIYQPGEHDNIVTVVANDANDEPEKYPLDITLTNPTTPIRGIDMMLCIDDNSIRPWVYDEDEEAYAYDLNSKRTYKTAQANIFLNTEEHPSYPGYLHALVNDSRDFKLTEGTIATIYIDVTTLAKGAHTLHVISPMCSYVGADFSTASYFCNDETITFNVEGSTITIIDGINTIYPPYPPTFTYDLSGRPTQAVRHGFYIKNGKKIIR